MQRLTGYARSHQPCALQLLGQSSVLFRGGVNGVEEKDGEGEGCQL